MVPSQDQGLKPSANDANIAHPSDPWNVQLQKHQWRGDTSYILHTKDKYGQLRAITCWFFRSFYADRHFCRIVHSYPVRIIVLIWGQERHALSFCYGLNGRYDSNMVLPSYYENFMPVDMINMWLHVNKLMWSICGWKHTQNTNANKECFTYLFPIFAIITLHSSPKSLILIKHIIYISIRA